MPFLKRFLFGRDMLLLASRLYQFFATLMTNCWLTIEPPAKVVPCKERTSVKEQRGQFHAQHIIFLPFNYSNNCLYGRQKVCKTEVIQTEEIEEAPLCLGWISLLDLETLSVGEKGL